MPVDPHPVIWLHHAGQHLGLVPSLGGGVAAWQIDPFNDPLDAEQLPLHLWRPWAGVRDCYTLACMPLVPWSNRISGGGFEHHGVTYPLAPNRLGELYPIHGDGWLQPWGLNQPAPDTLEMTLKARAFGAGPYHYHALQRFVLIPGGMQQTLEVTHMGAQPLPYGLGIHPWFERTPRAQLSAAAQGLWLSGADRLPTRHSTEFPAGWDPCQGLDLSGTLIDNAYTGWSGQARIVWPERQLALTMVVQEVQGRGQNDGFFLLYRPSEQDFFCVEPVTHPIDAFHLPGWPGLKLLHPGEKLSMQVQWQFEPL